MIEVIGLLFKEITWLELATWLTLAAWIFILLDDFYFSLMAALGTIALCWAISDLVSVWVYALFWVILGATATWIIVSEFRLTKQLKIEEQRKQENLKATRELEYAEQRRTREEVSKAIAHVEFVTKKDMMPGFSLIRGCGWVRSPYRERSYAEDHIKLEAYRRGANAVVKLERLGKHDRSWPEVQWEGEAVIVRKNI